MQYIPRQLAFFILFSVFSFSGHAWAQIGMLTERMGQLTVTLVYPTEQAVRSEKFGAFELQVAMNAAPAPKLSNGRLIVMSHGTAGSAMSDHEMAASFARAGFVVAQPLHRGDNYLDSKDAGPVSFARRPLEVSAVIDALAKEARFAPWLKTDKVGVHGMSSGGNTALSMAGGQWRLLDLVRHCAANLAADEGFCFNGIAPGDAGEAERSKRNRDYKLGAAAPEAFLPQFVRQVHPQDSLKLGAQIDPRVAVATLVVPTAAMFTQDSLKAIRIPVGVVSAGKDEWLVPRFHSAQVLSLVPNSQTIAHLPQAAHMDLLGPWPKEVARAVAARTAKGGEVSPTFDAKDRVAAFERIAAFMKLHLLTAQ